MLVCTMSIALTACSTTDAQQPPSVQTRQDVFFLSLRNYLGNRYPGRVDPDGTPENPFGDEPLEIEFTIASYDEIRIPMRVGDDRSRTWIITRTDSGLELRHDHRDPDGTPHDVTDYGGISTDDGTIHRQHFPANEKTAAMIPEAATNVWTLELKPDRRELIYNLTRHGEPRFRAVFDLSRPLQQ